MSAQLKAFGKGIDLTKIKTCLFGSDQSCGRHNRANFFTVSLTPLLCFAVNVLNDTENCVSPGGEIIVFGHGNRIVTFTRMTYNAHFMFTLFSVLIDKPYFYFLVKWLPNPSDNICQMYPTFWSNVATQSDEYVLTCYLIFWLQLTIILTQNIKLKLFVSNWSNSFCLYSFSETITSVLCLPIAAVNTKLSRHCSPDWFCIAIGFSSGYMRFYTEVSFW